MAAKIILVTGGNRSIGLGIVQSLAMKASENTVIIACRNKSNAQEAATQLQTMGFGSLFYPLALDVTSNDSIEAAVSEVVQQFGRLDVLINNAGIARFEEDVSTWRTAWAEVMDTNVVSVRILTELFLPLLRKSPDPRVINISSLRGSASCVTQGKNPPSASMIYSVSKAALNMTTIEMGLKNQEVSFYAASPGHCKTAFNGFRGKKDPLDGGKVAAELAVAERGRYPAGTFWEYEGNGMEEVGW